MHLSPAAKDAAISLLDAAGPQLSGDMPETGSATQGKTAGWEHHAVESSFFQKLADAAGYRSFDECWDALFDVSLRHADTESFRRDLAYFCVAVRATTPRERMELDGTLLREAHMWSTITRTLAETGTPPVYNSLAPYSYLRHGHPGVHAGEARGGHGEDHHRVRLTRYGVPPSSA